MFVKRAPFYKRATVKRDVSFARRRDLKSTETSSKTTVIRDALGTYTRKSLKVICHLALFPALFEHI